MFNLECKEIIKSLRTDIIWYKERLEELKYYLAKKFEIYYRYDGNTDRVDSCIKLGEIIETIKTEYVSIERIFNDRGEIVDFKREYIIKPILIIEELDKYISELNKNRAINRQEIEEMQEILIEYKRKNIFRELFKLEKLIAPEKMDSYNDFIEFRDNLLNFNGSDINYKYSNINDFCKENIEENYFVKEIMFWRKCFIGFEETIDIISSESQNVLEKWTSTKLKPILKTNEESYFIISTLLNKVEIVTRGVFGIDTIEEQIDRINELINILDIQLV